jgi:Spy/CpxP family protein refolding chaperone
VTKRIACLLMILGAWCFSHTAWAQPLPVDPPEGNRIESPSVSTEELMMLAQADGENQGEERDFGRAQQPAGPPGGRRQARMFEQFRTMKMLELLDLTDAQEGPFMAAYQKLRKGLRSVDDRKRKAIDDMAISVKAKTPNDQEINKRIDVLLGLEQERRDLLRAFAQDARQILTAPQAGRLMLFAERFEPAVAERIQAMRRGMGPGMRRQLDSSGQKHR